MGHWDSQIHDFNEDYQPPTEVTVNGFELQVEGYDILSKQDWFISRYTSCTNCKNRFEGDEWALHLYGPQPWKMSNNEWAMVPCYYCQTMRMVSREWWKR